jgi:succinoglycan biosynthesis transport protein ExoP
LRAIQLHKKVLLACVLCGVFLAAAYVFRVWPVYTAESRVYVQPASSSVMSHNGDQRWPFDSNTYESFIQQQVQNADNPAVLADALHTLGAGVWQKPGESEEIAARRLGKSLEVTRLGTSYEVSIIANAGNPQQAAQIANGMAAALIAHASKQQNAGDRQRIAILHDERNRVQQQLNADLTEQSDLNQKLGMASVGTSTPDLLDSAIVTARDELIKARTDHDQASARLASLDASKGGSSKALQGEAEDLIALDPGLTAMKGSLYQRRAALISHMANLTQDNPAYKMDADELAKINGSLDSMMTDLRTKAAGRIQEKLRADLERTAGVESRLNGQLRQLSASAAGSTPKMQRANDLATDIVRLHTRYAAVDEEFQDLLLKDNVPGAMHLSVSAIPPESPTVSRVARKAVPLAAGGLVLGLFLVLLLYNLDRKIYIAEDIQHLIGVAPVVCLPSLANVSSEVYDEYVLRLSAKIERTLKLAKSHNCIFTGVDFGVGVSTLANRTRELLEGLGQKAVMADSHAARRSTSQSEDETAGTQDSHSIALQQRQKEEARPDSNCVVISDAAPLVASAETEFMVRSAGSVIVVARSGVTTRQQLLAMAQTLQRMNVSAVDFVLNNVQISKADRTFRDSVAAVEKHVRAQGHRTVLRPTRNLIPEEEELPAPAVVAQAPVPAPQIPHPAPVEQSLPVPEKKEQKALDQGAAPDPLFELGRRISELHEKFVPAQMASASKPASGRRAAEEPVSSQPEKTPRDEEQSEPVEAQSEGASRLNGLRAILFEQGLKNLNHNYENEPEVPLPAQAFSPGPRPSFRAPVEEARAPQAPPPHRPAVDLPKVVDVPKAVAFKAPPREVVAEPEFLPPREFIPVKGEEEEGNEKADAHHDRRDPFDELEILPSWHGQYRRKS